MVVIKEGKLWLKFEKSKIGCLKLKNFKFKQYCIRISTSPGNETKLNLDIININSDKLIRTISLPDKLLSMQRAGDRNCCILLTLPNSYHIFAAFTSETDLHEWLSVLLSVYQPLLTPAISNAFLCYFISATNPLVIKPAYLELWMCIEREELKIYQAHDLHFVLSIEIARIRSFEIILNCDKTDADKILEINFEVEEINQKSTKFNKRDSKKFQFENNILRLFSLNCKEMLQCFQSKNYGDENVAKIKGCQKSPKTKTFKRISPLSTSKSLENLFGKTFSVRSFNCLSPNKTSESSPTSSKGSIHSQISSSTNSQQKSPPLPPLPSKEDLERRENKKLMQQIQYKTLDRATSKSVDNCACLDSLVTGSTFSFKDRSPVDVPPLPPRAHVTKRRESLESKGCQEDDPFYKFLPVGRLTAETTEAGMYKILTKSGGPVIEQPKDRKNLYLDLASDQTHYKVLSPVVTPVRPAVTPVKARNNLSSCPTQHPVSSNGYEVLHNVTRKSQPRPFLSISSETQV